MSRRVGTAMAIRPVYITRHKLRFSKQLAASRVYFGSPGTTALYQHDSPSAGTRGRSLSRPCPPPNHTPPHIGR